MNLRPLLLVAIALGLTACGSDNPLPITGTLERDQMELVAEAQEPIVQIAVHEGDRVKAGDLILQLDPSVATAAVTQAEAARDQAAAKLPGTDASFTRAQKDFDRSQALVKEHTQPQSQLDQARDALDNARAARNVAAAALAQAQAALDQYKISLDRLSVRAPRDATVDSLPYHLGERPPTRAVVAVLLDASATYAQIFIPEPLRAKAVVGSHATIKFDGSAKSYTGILRYVSEDASFTPYYSLTERDRSRLAYLAKVYLSPGDSTGLPSGAPVSVDFPDLH
ncbi:MAG TPA: HlyD family efflux transporter periplasmic adaptor subunit [Gammaproteobacteria bacterium]|jgi:HlyD family secretion protein